MRNDFIGMTGRDQILEEIAVSKLYNTDHRTRKGKVQRNVNKLHPGEIPCIVTDIRQESPSAKTIRLTPQNGYIPPFYPGQYISVAVEVQGVRTSRAYSISSPATERRFYEITVRSSAAGFVSDYLLNTLKPGDTLTCLAPTGQFYRFDAVHGKKLVFIAGGSGITPFMSMLQTDAEQMRDDYRINLIYGCSCQDDIIFHDRLNALAGELSGFTLNPIISEPEADCKYDTGFITAEYIKKTVPDYADCTFFLCGPSVMYDFVLAELEKLNIPRSRVRKEVQTLPADPTKLAAWPQEITVKDTFKITLPDGQTIDAKATDTILETVERSGLEVRTQCRAGECSLCRTKLKSGKVFQPEHALLRRSDMKFGYIHPCVTYPISDIELL